MRSFGRHRQYLGRHDLLLARSPRQMAMVGKVVQGEERENHRRATKDKPIQIHSRILFMAASGRRPYSHNIGLYENIPVEELPLHGSGTFCPLCRSRRTYQALLNLSYRHSVLILCFIANCKSSFPPRQDLPQPFLYKVKANPCPSASSFPPPYRKK